MKGFKNTSYKLERFLRSFASKKRIEILFVISKKKDISLEEIRKIVKTNKQNISHHTFVLYNAGLIAKQQRGTKIVHALTNKGKAVLAIISKIDKNI